MPTFNLLGEDSIACPEKRRRISFRPIATANDYALYLRFKSPTTRLYYKQTDNIIFIQTSMRTPAHSSATVYYYNPRYFFLLIASSA